MRQRDPERVAHIVAPGGEVLSQEKQGFGGRGSRMIRCRGQYARRDRVEIGGRKVLQGANYNEPMIVVRFATLVALVVWLGAMTAARFGDLLRPMDLVAYACGAVTIVGLFVMKFIGPPPHGFVPRAGIAIAMLAIAIAAAFTRTVDLSTTLLTVNVALGFVLLTWYVRE